MSDGIGIAPVAAGNSGNNLTMLEAVTKDLEKKEEDEKKAEAKSAPAADKVSLSTDAKEAAKEAARTEIRGIRKRLSSARKEMRIVSHDLKHMGADEKAVEKNQQERGRESCFLLFYPPPTRSRSSRWASHPMTSRPVGGRPSRPFRALSIRSTDCSTASAGSLPERRAFTRASRAAR